jgi:hypothetical protein
VPIDERTLSRGSGPIEILVEFASFGGGLPPISYRARSSAGGDKVAPALSFPNVEKTKDGGTRRSVVMAARRVAPLHPPTHRGAGGVRALRGFVPAHGNGSTRRGSAGRGRGGGGGGAHPPPRRSSTVAIIFLLGATKTCLAWRFRYFANMTVVTRGCIHQCWEVCRCQERCAFYIPCVLRASV